MQYPEVTPQTIWNFRQNNPELVIRDAKQYLNLDEKQCELLRKILLARGVNKWLKVRRDLIAYKKAIKHDITRIMKIRKSAPPREKAILLPTLKFAEKVRADLRQLCKTDRWQIWPTNKSHHESLRLMNTLKVSDKSDS